MPHDADIDRHRCLVATGKWCRTHAAGHYSGIATEGTYIGIRLAMRLSVHPLSDLSGDQARFDAHQGGRTSDRGVRSRLHPQDRKSVVEGKSVYVRVDHGGRRIIKKKQKKNEQKQIS